MGIQINGITDTISATDGGLAVSGQQLTGVTNINASGIITATQGYVVGTGASVFSPAANTLAFGTNGSERLRVLASGGLTFNVDTAATYALDDIEEGTFTPFIIGSTTTGTATYAAQRGKYTKVGNRVFWEIYISWTGGTGTGDLRVSGLPFTISNTLATFPTASIGYAHNVTTIADHQLIALQASGDTYVYFYQIPSGGGVNVGLAYDAIGVMILSGDYNVA